MSMKKLGLICSFLIFTHALFAQLTVTPSQFSLTPGTSTPVTFTFNCDFDGNVVPTTTAPGVTFTGLIPFPAPPFAPVTKTFLCWLTFFFSTTGSFYMLL